VPARSECGHRVAWDLRLPPPDPVRLEAPGAAEASGTGGVERLGEVQSLTVKPVVDPSSGSSMTPEDYQAIFAFQQETRNLLRRAQGAAEELGRLNERLAYLRAAVAETPGAEPTVYERLGRLEASAAEVGTTLTGDAVRGRLNAPTPPSVLGRLGQIAGAPWTPGRRLGDEPPPR